MTQESTFEAESFTVPAVTFIDNKGKGKKVLSNGDTTDDRTPTVSFDNPDNLIVHIYQNDELVFTYMPESNEPLGESSIQNADTMIRYQFELSDGSHNLTIQFSRIDMTGSEEIASRDFSLEVDTSALAKFTKQHGSEAGDVLAGTDERDAIWGHGGDDSISGGAGNDKLRGNKGDDSIDGGAGNDNLKGGKGDDSLSGGEGNDKLHGNKGDDSLSGGQGNDKLYGGRGDDALSGGEDNDKLHGGRGNDSLNGDQGNDKLYGGRGEDALDGGLGDDILSGGADADIFHFDIARSSTGADTITDFSVADGDKIALTELLLDDVASDLIDNVLNSAVETEKGGVMLTLSDDSTVTLAGLSLEALSRDLFNVEQVVPDQF